MQFIYAARHSLLLLESVLYDCHILEEACTNLVCQYARDSRGQFEGMLLRQAQRLHPVRPAFETFCALVCDELLCHCSQWTDFAAEYLYDLCDGQGMTDAEIELLLREALTPVVGHCNRLLCFQRSKCRCPPGRNIMPQEADICVTKKRKASVLSRYF